MAFHSSTGEVEGTITREQWRRLNGIDEPPDTNGLFARLRAEIEDDPDLAGWVR